MYLLQNDIKDVQYYKVLTFRHYVAAVFAFSTVCKGFVLLFMLNYKYKL